MLVIRAEAKEDQPVIRRINEQAFGRVGEADLVEALRAKVHPYISLVAVSDSQVVGHILFTPVSIVYEGATYNALALGPMAVLPEFQNQGIGSELVQRGLDECRGLGYEVVIVVGRPKFYPRFGFMPARQKGLESEFDIPDEVFMVAELRDGALSEVRGIVKYHPEFDRV